MSEGRQPLTGRGGRFPGRPANPPRRVAGHGEIARAHRLRRISSDAWQTDTFGDPIARGSTCEISAAGPFNSFTLWTWAVDLLSLGTGGSVADCHFPAHDGRRLTHHPWQVLTETPDLRFFLCFSFSPRLGPQELFEQVGAVKKSGVNFDEQGRSKVRPSTSLPNVPHLLSRWHPSTHPPLQSAVSASLIARGVRHAAVR